MTVTRYAMSKMGKYGDPEKFLYDLVSTSSLNARLDYVHKLVDNALRGQWGEGVMRRQLSNMINQIKTLITRVSTALKRYLDKYLPHAPTTSANVSSTITKPKPHGRPTATPKKQAANVTYAKSKSHTAKKGNNKDDVGGGKSHNRKIDTTLSKSLTGIIGEHMGDYWVAKELGYTVHHDQGRSYPFKLDGPMTMLNGKARGTGIDSLWKTDHRPLGKNRTQKFAKTLYTFDRAHAIVEYKASTTKDHKSLGEVLSKNTRKKRSAKSKIGKKDRTTNDNNQRDENYQMSEDWSKDRLSKRGYSDTVTNFSRHVLYFGAAAIADHSLALSKDLKNPEESEHRQHSATWIADGSAIDTVNANKKKRSSKRGK